MFAFIRFDVHWTRIINELQKSAGELFEVFSNTAFVWIGMGQMNKAVATEKKSAENFISGYNLENVTGRRHAHELMFTWATLIRARAHQRCYSKQVVFNVWRRVETKSLFSETTIKDFVRLTDFKIRRRCIYKYKRRSLDIYIYSNTTERRYERKPTRIVLSWTFWRWTETWTPNYLTQYANVSGINTNLAAKDEYGKSKWWI